MIRSISFDLWLTLIKSHPQFKLKRAELLADRFNPDGLTCGEILERVKLVDKLCDGFNERKGCKIAAEIMYSQVLLSLGNSVESVTHELLVELKQEANRLFVAHPPVFLNKHIPAILDELRQDGMSLNLSSNTGFIESDCLAGVLQAIGLYDYFDFCIFSDEIKASKPSPVFFQKVLENRNGVGKQEILHIGDNPNTDYKGAIDFGFNAFLITNQQYSINDIRKAISAADH